VSEETYRLYARELAEYEETDIAEAVRIIGRRKREQYEPAFPDLGTMLDEVIKARNARKAKEAEDARRAQEAAELADLAAHPENYFHISELLKEIPAARGVGQLTKVDVAVKARAAK
jgi:hypothetical protein